MLLSNISSQFFNALISLLTVLSLMWSLIFTIFNLILTYKKLKPSITPFLNAKWQILPKNMQGKKIVNVAVEEAIESDQPPFKLLSLSKTKVLLVHTHNC